METRTNIVLDDELVAKAMAKAGVTTKKAAIDTALRAYVRDPDWQGLLALAGSGVLADDYDPAKLFVDAPERPMVAMPTVTHAAKRRTAIKPVGKSTKPSWRRAASDCRHLGLGRVPAQDGFALRPALAQGVARRATVWMPAVVLQELLQGTRNPAQFARFEAQLERLPGLDELAPRDVARDAALLYARCRCKGSRCAARTIASWRLAPSPPDCRCWHWIGTSKPSRMWSPRCD